MCKIILTTLILLLPACSTGLSGPQGTPVSVSIIDNVTFTPSSVHPGDTVLISYHVGSEIVHDNGGTYADVYLPPELSASAGEITPLHASVYQPGGALPEFAAAAAAYGGLSEFGPSDSDIWDCFQEPNYYMLYLAPDSAQDVEIKFWLGGGGGPGSSKSRHTLKLKVQ